MKKLTYFASLAAMLLFAACSSDTEDFVAENATAGGKTITIEASMPEGTRVNSDNLEALKWEAGDVLKAYCYDAQGFMAGGAPVNFTLDETSIAEGTAKFTGTIPNDAISCTFFYTKMEDLTCDQWAQNYALAIDKEQVQDKLNSTSHIKNYIALQSERIEPANVGKEKVNLRLMNPVLRINVKNMPAELASAASSSIKFTINPYAQANLNLNAQMTNGSDNFIYMVAPPMYGFDPGYELKLEFTAGLNKFTARGKARNKISGYQPGKIYTLVVDNDSTKEAPAFIWDKETESVDLTQCLQMKFNGGNPAKVGEYKKVGEAANGLSYYYNAESVNEIRQIGYAGAFQNNKELQEVVIPANVITIGESAFAGCISLSKVTFNEGLQTIGAFAFQECEALTDVVIPEGVTTIGGSAFSHSNTGKMSLANITFPSTITEFGWKVLNNCTMISNVYVNVPFDKLSASSDMQTSFSKLFGKQLFPSSETGLTLHLPASYDGCTNTAILQTPVDQKDDCKFCGVYYLHLIIG